MTILARLLALGMAAALAGCNTVAGVGADLQVGGAAIVDSAQDAQRRF